MNCMNDKISKYIPVLTLWNEWWEIRCCPPHIQPVRTKYIGCYFIQQTHYFASVAVLHETFFQSNNQALCDILNQIKGQKCTWTDLKTSKILNDACWPGKVLLLSSSSSRSSPWQEFWSPEVCFWWCAGLLYWCCWVSVSVLDPEGRCTFVAWIFAPDGNSSGNSKSSHFRSLKNLSWCIV